MRATKITLFLITAAVFQTSIVRAADHHAPKLALQSHLHHLEATHHPAYPLQPNFQTLGGETAAPAPSTFSLAAYFISLFAHNR